MSWLRETALLRLVGVLWTELSPEQQDALRPRLEADRMGWALPSLPRWQPDDWLTTEQVAGEFGLKPTAVWNWPRRYGIRPVDGMWRWGDVLLVRLRQTARNAA